MNPTGHILIIDDEASLRQTLARILQRDGYEVTSVASGMEGLSLVAQHPFDLVYLDIRMPDMNGLDVSEDDPRPAAGASGDPVHRPAGSSFCGRSTPARGHRLLNEAPQAGDSAGPHPDHLKRTAEKEAPP